MDDDIIILLISLDVVRIVALVAIKDIETMYAYYMPSGILVKVMNLL